MTGVWLPPGKQRFVDPATGIAMVGGLVYHYIPGTDTPKDTWSDQDQTALNTNPIVLDGDGQCEIWGSGLYRQILKTSVGVTIWDEATGFLDTGATVTFASPAEVAAGTSMDTVISPYALANSGVLTIPYATPSEVATGTVANKVISPKALADSGVLALPYATPMEVAALASFTKVISPGALGASGVLSGGGGSAINSLTQFGFIGDGVTDNAPFLAAMLASASWDMYVPTGIYYISGTSTTVRASLIKRFWGPGRFLTDDGWCLPGRYSNISTPPTLWPTQGPTGWFHGQTESVEGEWTVLGPLVRESLTARYFEGATIPHNIWYDVESGSSGMLSVATGGLIIGAGSAVLVSVDGISMGQVLGVTPWGQDGPITDTITIDTVNTGTKTITFHPNLTTAYPNSVPNGAAPGRATFLSGKRTWAGIQYLRVQSGVQAGGDVYGGIARLTQQYQPKGGQIHCFNTGTIGLFGGDMNFIAGSSGTYGTGWENAGTDQGNDVAYAAFVDSFSRANDTGARSCGWFGHVMQSGGGRPVDVGNVLRGSFRWGMDVGLSSLEDSTNLVDPITGGIGATSAKVLQVGNVVVGESVGFCDVTGAVIEVKVVASLDYVNKVIGVTTAFATSYLANARVVVYRGGGAVNMSLGQTAIVFNSSSSNTARTGDPAGVYGPQYSNVTGDMIMRSGNDGTSDYISMFFNRASPNNGRIRLRPSGAQINVPLTVAGSIAGTSDVACGPASLLAFGVGSGIFFTVIAGHIYASIDGGGSYGLIR